MTGFILYEGPSAFDRRAIVAIVTTGRSRNRKTGDVVQTWILPADSAPHDAVWSGADSTVCGDCPLRARAGCYVRVEQAPLSIWRAWRAGRYAPWHPAATAGRPIRLGSYGDPAAVPFAVWAALAGRIVAGYTHAWRTCDPAFASVCMASCETVTDAWLARALGWRTFRLRAPGAPHIRYEIECPSERGVQCADCRACAGLSARARVNIAIETHGARRAKATAATLAA